MCVLGIGDDAALLEVPAGSELVAAHRHAGRGPCTFPRGSPPRSIGHRALAVNLSDLAAMGAKPAWALLALTLPQADEPGWSDLPRVCARWRASTAWRWWVATPRRARCASRCSCWACAAGDGTAALAAARPGDVLFVSGTPGDAAAGLALEQGKPRRPHGAADARLSARAVPVSDAARGARASACAACERLHRRLRRPARRCRQARGGERLRRAD